MFNFMDTINEAVKYGIKEATKVEVTKKENGEIKIIIIDDGNKENDSYDDGPLF